MDVLWRKPRDTTHLVDLLPERCFTWKPDMDCDYLDLVPSSRPSDADWARFDVYARRVRALSVERYARGAGLPMHWCAILDHFSGGQPFPRLRSLFWEWTPDYGCSHANFLLRPPLQELYIDDVDAKGVRNIIDVLPNCVLTLKYLRVSGLFRSEDEHEVAVRLWQALAELQQLVDLDVSLYVPQAFRHLASLSNLTKLHLPISSAHVEGTKALFPALKSLYVSVRTDMDAVAKLLQRMALPVLERLRIDYHTYVVRGGAVLVRPPSTAHIHLVVREVSKLSLLRMFKLKGDQHIHSRSEPEEALDPSALSPLHALRDLETLDLSALAVELTAADIGPMARAWPRIQDLLLYQPHARMFGTRSPRDLQVSDLLPLAHLWPRLRELKLPLRIGPLAAPLDDGPELPVQSALETLWAAKISRPISTSALRVLARTFPSARVKGYGHATDLVEAVNKAKKTLVDEVYGGPQDTDS
ncbi:hypothetical protein PsYK624_118720 [Phanerochaete sordida]|uniref:F-box domain-containing protein n=1 Tax=Phanerochaete sordida TaxID=48140 RepID=A0A9P3GJ18_9APHY|nr:hypothetical protein PsYK624_118720 [Phanerochaete sordida]